MNKNVVIISNKIYSYPKEDTFRPSKQYPEYIFTELATKENHVYEMIREGFLLSGYDKENYGTNRWNPMGAFVAPGDCVLLKPNLVMDRNPMKDEGVECLYTQPSLVACVIDYVLIALQGKGEIIVGDAPMQECEFDKLVDESGYKKLIEFYNKKINNSDVKIRLVDFRGLKSKHINGINYSSEVPNNGIVVDLKNESEFACETDYFYNNMRITNYDPSILKQHHSHGKNEYYVNELILKADVIINMPKPKTHRKAGVTISLKNLVGINCRKEYLPHHTNGSKDEGGDEYLNRSRIKSLMDYILDKKNYYAQTRKQYKKVWVLNKVYGILSRLSNKMSKDNYYEGSWYGNDTISRTIVDLNKILFYADKNGNICNEFQRRYLIIADMIISGEKEGPVAPSAKNVGIIAMGEDPVCFDEAVSKLMGAKLEYIHTLRHARNPVGKLRFTEEDSVPLIVSNNAKWNNKVLDEIKDKDLLYFIPTTGWTNAFKRNGIL